MSPLTRLDAAHQAYDGPLPDHVREAALYGSETVAILTATGQATFFRNMAKGQVITIRKRREDGSIAPYMLRDLLLYRREFGKWNGLLWQLRRLEARKLSTRSTYTKAPTEFPRGRHLLDHPEGRS